jgi:hypothetical protein
MDDTISVKGRMAELFPLDNPATPWLIRLMIIRDDLQYEFQNLLLATDASKVDIWLYSYFLRRMSISLMEARSVLSCEAGKESKLAKDDLMNSLAPDVRAAVAVLDEASCLMKPLRDAIGAHVRPQNVDPAGGAVEVRVLRNWDTLEGEARFCLADFEHSSCQSLTFASLAFAWPDVDSIEKYKLRNTEIRDAVFSSVSKVIWAIDCLLIRHWWNLGLVRLPDGYDLGVRDPKTGKMVRVPDKPGK